MRPPTSPGSRRPSVQASEASTAAAGPTSPSGSASTARCARGSLAGVPWETWDDARVTQVRIGAASDVGPGKMRAFDVAGTKVNVANAGGTLYAIDDKCTHMGCSLAKGRLEGTTVTCPCHGSQFDVTSGAVLRGPATRPVRARQVSIDGEALLAES